MPNQKVVTAQTPVEVIFTKGSLAPFAQRLTIRISGKGKRDNMTDLELVLSIIVFGVLMYFCPSLLSDERKPTLDEFKCHCDAEDIKCPKKRISCRRMVFGNKNTYGKKNGRITKCNKRRWGNRCFMPKDIHNPYGQRHK